MPLILHMSVVIHASFTDSPKVPLMLLLHLLNDGISCVLNGILILPNARIACNGSPAGAKVGSECYIFLGTPPLSSPHYID